MLSVRPDARQFMCISYSASGCIHAETGGNVRAISSPTAMVSKHSLMNKSLDIKGK